MSVKKESIFLGEEGLKGFRYIDPETRVRSSNPYLFVPGMWSLAEKVFRNWAPFTAHAGHETFVLNPRGYGDSMPCDLGNASIWDFADDVRAALRKINRLTGRKVNLVGHSRGGLLAQMVAADDWSERLIHSLTLVATAPPRGIPLLGRTLGHLIAHLPYYLKVMLGHKSFIMLENGAKKLVLNNVENPGEVYASFVPESGRVACEMMLSLGIKVPASLPCPCHVVAGTKDLLTPLSVQNQVKERYDAYFSAYPLGHMMMIEPGWEAPISRIITFAESRTTPQASRQVA